MIMLSKHFETAVNDCLFLLEKSYPQKAILKMVGDRYQLSGQERSMLFRGIFPIEQCTARQQERVTSLTAGSKLHIDGYNVIRTVGSYLNGKPVFIAMDGFLRDAAEMHRSILKRQVSEKSLNMLMQFLSENAVKHVSIYLDEPVSKSGELSAYINRLLSENEIQGKAKTLRSPDYHLKLVTSGLICTADSAVIDECRVKVFDLAKAVLALKYSANFISLGTSYFIKH